MTNPAKPTNRSRELLELSSIKTLSKYDFIDLGAGDGASMINIERIIGGKGVGVELSRIKVMKATELSRNVYLGNALHLEKIPGKVDYVTCDNFLEHLLTHADVFSMLEQASKVARKFIYIRHPSFENTKYLKGMGLKTYWSHWHGHTAHVKIAEFIEMLNTLGIYGIKVVPVYKIVDSSDSKILPESAPIDQHDYDAKIHGKKPRKIKFTKNVYYAFDIIAMMPGFENEMPELTYKDRMYRTSHPIFSFGSKVGELEKELRKAHRDIDELHNRKAIKIAKIIKKPINFIKH